MQLRPSEDLKKAIYQLAEKRAADPQVKSTQRALREAFLALLQQLAIPMSNINRYEECSEMKELYFIPFPKISPQIREELSENGVLIYRNDEDTDDLVVISPISEINDHEVFSVGMVWEVWELMIGFYTKEKLEMLFQYDLWYGAMNLLEKRVNGETPTLSDSPEFFSQE
ncbi:MAG: hypothetical protein P1V18_00285 [Candidatus Gracilibacteria bacterium]|nr:hypothetical protein [Candidatus Gracilibacteria bacterium]